MVQAESKPLVGDDVAAAPARRCFDVDEYYRMGEAGILGVDERVELLEGEIITMPPIGSGHSGGVNRLAQPFFARLAGRAIVSVQNPVRLSSGSEPVPDIVLLRPRADFYTASHPGPDDVLLLIEVADSSLGYDRGRKLAVYAVAGIAEYWIIDLRGGRILIYRHPKDGEFTQMLIAERDATISSLAFPDVLFSAAELLG
ncbi:MAG: Uma2 family endonuclease [Dehalococcoidia bacterium]